MHQHKSVNKFVNNYNHNYLYNRQNILHKYLYMN